MFSRIGLFVVSFVVGSLMSPITIAQEPRPIGPADADDDGRVSLEEWTDYASQRLGDMGEEDLGRLFREIDGDDDGSLSAREFRRRMEVLARIREEGFAPESEATATKVDGDTATSLVGRWSLDVDWIDGPRSATVDIRTDDGFLTGVFTTDDSRHDIAVIARMDDRVRFAIGGDGLVLTGTHDGAHGLVGKIATPFGSLEFRGRQTPLDADNFVGRWDMVTKMGERTVESVMTLLRDGDDMNGTWESLRGTMNLDDLTIDGTTIRFVRRITNDFTIPFEGKLDGDTIVGVHRFEGRDVSCRGTRVEMESRERRPRRRAAKRYDDPEKDYDHNSFRAVPRDSFPVLTNPELIAADAIALANDESVIGVVVGGEARAYPISIMGSHELVNDTCGGVPIAAAW